MSYIALDVGTSGCKASIIEKDGTILFTASREYPFESPLPGYVELNPVTVWNATKEVLRDIAPQAKDATMLAATSIGESMVIVDKKDRVLYNGITYMDQRCENTIEALTKKIPLRKLYETTGVSVNPMFTLNKFIWFRENRPDVLENADKYFMFVDYINYMLCGERAVDPGSASRTMFFDFESWEWSSEVADLFDVPIDRFSKITQPGTTIGPIRRELAQELGLPTSLNIVMGIHDQCAATLGSNSLRDGDIMLGQGTTESINYVVEKSRIDSLVYDNELSIEPYIDKDHYMIITGNLTHGTSISWFLRNFYEDYGTPAFSYDELYKSVPESSSEVYFLPHLSEVSLLDRDNTALGVFLGINVTTTREQMFRAVLEGLCCETRVSMDVFRAIGKQVGKITASGGNSVNAMYMQMKSDIIQDPIHVLENPQAGIMGLMMICAVADGAYADFYEAADDLLKIKRVYTPQKDYSRQYQNYCLINQKVNEIYAGLK